MADTPKTKGMVALLPTAADAERLVVEGGLPLDELHLTLLFLGDAADWDDEARTTLLGAMRAVSGSGAVDGDAFALSVFNAGNDEHDTCIVLGVGGQAIDDIHTAVVDAATYTVPEQRAPWHAHLSLIYTDDLSMLAELVDRTGPITFDRLRVAFADAVTDIPLDPEGLGATNRHGQPRGDAVDKSRLKTASPATAQNASKPWYRIENMAGTGAAEVFIYDELSPWGVTADDFVRDLRQITNTKIDLHLHSPGGNAWDGIAIFQALKNHPAEVTVYVDSLAASAASFIAQAGDRRVVGPHATMMIHEASGMCWGDAADMKKTAEDLERLSANLASIYANRGGGDVETWRDAMRAETWYTAQEAVAAGLMDEVLPDEKARKEPAMKNRFDLSVFNFAGRDKAPRPLNVADTAPAVEEPTLPIPTPGDPSPDGDATPELPAVEPEQPNEPKEDPVSDLSEVRSRLDLADDADTTAILAAVDALKAKAETPTDPDPATTAVVEAKDQENADLRKEVELVSARMQALSDELAATKAQKAAEVKASFLDQAQKQGKFKPVDRASWEKDYDEAPSAVTRILNNTAVGSAVPVSPTGEVGSAEPDGTDDEFDKIMARLDGPTVRKVA